MLFRSLLLVCTFFGCLLGLSLVAKKKSFYASIGLSIGVIFLLKVVEYYLSEQNQIFYPVYIFQKKSGVWGIFVYTLTCALIIVLSDAIKMLRLGPVFFILLGFLSFLVTSLFYPGSYIGYTGTWFMFVFYLSGALAILTDIVLLLKWEVLDVEKYQG